MERRPKKVRCRYYWDPEVVKYFSKDTQIRRTTARALFRKRVHDGVIKCYKFSENHKQCVSYGKWKEFHPAEYVALLEEAAKKPRSVFIPMSEVINVYGRDVKVSGGIKSLSPPCLEEATTHGKNPFTCVNCAKQERDLKNTLQHRLSGSLKETENRIGIAGFNKRYARKGELEEALDKEGQRRKTAEKQVKELVQIQLSPKDVEDRLMNSCMAGDEQKLFVDLVRLFKSGIARKNPVQILVLKNLVSKLLRNNNHHYVSLIKDLSGVFKNQLGPTNYSILAEVFGLARQTTATKHGADERLDPGINVDVLSKASSVFKKSPVNEASDGARALRYLQARKSKDGSVGLIGHGWNPDVHRWESEYIPIPRRDPSKGDKDDFSALKRFIDQVVARDSLAKTVSIHNLTSLTSVETPSVIYCMWPTIEKGYTGKHLLNYWQHLRRLCFYDEKGAKRDHPIHLLGYSTDSAGFSLSAAVHLMTPNKEEIDNGVLHLGLGLEDEKFLAPYYWFLPAISYLDYDHEQRLFMKNLKYETRELTFWRDEGSITRMASIHHLKDLRRRCQENGLDCGLKATDLILIYFCDQNSDACERLFTERIADLLDVHVPGSQGTSLYIRAVYHLIEPFRKPNFGSPVDVQKSVSCGIMILRLWKKVLELQKLPLNSKPGAKNNPSNRGNFITRGCYLTAEILFAAATLHQLAMFLHFPEEAGVWASPYNSGTKSTERIISELQGKTTELQSLDSQPTFGDMLDKSGKVQFNLNAKKRVAAAGINVKASSKRKQLAFAFKSHETSINYQHPKTYSALKEQQRQAHRNGVRKGQALFEKYMPQHCVNLLKENDSWEIPYKFQHPDGLHIVNGELPKNYNKLDLDVSAGSLLADVEQELVRDCDDEEWQSTNDDRLTPEGDTFDNASEEVENYPAENQGRKWMISKHENGKLSNIHISQALKLLLPREYIARCRQKRHWASKFLPGKEPLNPEHDIVLFGNVAIKKVLNGNSFYLITRVERIESTKDGTEILSFRLKDNPAVRVRCSVYDRGVDGYYHVGEDIVLTSWRSPKGILSAIELLPLSGCPSKYRLHESSYNRLKELGHVPYGETPPAVTSAEDISVTEEPHELGEGFYEVEDVLERRLNKDMTYEFKVRFKGYGPADDMWLPASAFNRPVSFASTSRFGRKRKHKTDVEDPTSSLQDTCREGPLEKTPKSSKRRRVEEHVKETERDVPHGSDHVVKSESILKTRSSKPKQNKAPLSKRATTKKGKVFRQGLHSTQVNKDRKSEATNENPEHVVTLSSDDECVKSQNMSSSNMDVNSYIMEDIKRRNDNFMSPRRHLANAVLPVVDRNIRSYRIERLTSESNLQPQDPLTVARVPPMSVLEASQKALLKSVSKKTKKRMQEYVVTYSEYGCFTLEGLRILTRYDKVRTVSREVPEEIRWMAMAFEKITNIDRNRVAEALLDRWNTSGSYLVERNGYRITSQDLSVLCCERYLNDEVMNLLIIKFCNEANERLGENVFCMLPSYVKADFGLSVIHHLCANTDITSTEIVFFPVHLHGNHWGLSIFYIKKQEVQFDDGYHCAITKELEGDINSVLATFHEATNLPCFELPSWGSVKRFSVPMPDQPTGSGSCGVAVVCCVRDICNGFNQAFTWTFEDVPHLRAQLMVELLNV